MLWPADTSCEAEIVCYDEAWVEALEVKDHDWIDVHAALGLQNQWLDLGVATRRNQWTIDRVRAQGSPPGLVVTRSLLWWAKGPGSSESEPA